jgi:uridylate kinase
MIRGFVDGEAMAASQGQYRRFLGRAIDVEGENGGFAAVERATSDLRSAIDGADVIIVVTGGNATRGAQLHARPR